LGVEWGRHETQNPKPKTQNCLVAQLVAHRSDTARVGGSSPFETTVAAAYWFADKNVALVDTGSIPVSHPN
jgi:hypothetical protein